MHADLFYGRFRDQRGIFYCGWCCGKQIGGRGLSSWTKRNRRSVGLSAGRSGAPVMAQLFGQANKDVYPGKSLLAEIVTLAPTLNPTLRRLRLVDSLSRWLRSMCTCEMPMDNHPRLPEGPEILVPIFVAIFVVRQGSGRRSGRRWERS